MKSNTAIGTRRLKHAATINDEALSEETDPDFELQYVDISNVDSSGEIHEIATHRFEAAPSRARRIVRDGDVIISTVRTYLQAIAPIENPPDNLIVSTGFAVVRPSPQLDRQFCKFALREPEFLAEVERRSVGVSYPAINASDLAAIHIPLPSLDEQQAIAGFLDRETARLDALVVEKERWLELLAEKRRALIAHAVTRGVHGVHPLGCSGAADRLKPGHQTLPFRDSGLTWLGQIPANWDVPQFKFACASLQTGPFGSQLHAEDYVADGIPVINSAHLDQGKIIPDANVAVDEATADSLSIHKLQRDDIVFARRGELGRCGVVLQEHEGWLCGTGSLRARLRLIAANPNYIALLFSETDAAAWLTLASVGSTMDNMNTEMLGEFRIPLPPLDEQRAIVAHISAETAKLDGLRAATERTIGLLKERRAALIAAAVTGKISVRASAA